MGGDAHAGLRVETAGKGRGGEVRRAERVWAAECRSSRERLSRAGETGSREVGSLAGRSEGQRGVQQPQAESKQVAAALLGQKELVGSLVQAA